MDLKDFISNENVFIQDNSKSDLENNFLTANFENMKIKKVKNVLKSWW